MDPAINVLVILDAERDHWRKRENELSGTQDLYAVGEATGAQKTLRRVREMYVRSLISSASNAPPLSDVEWTTLWMSLRYAAGRETIAAATLPGDIVQVYYWRLSEGQRAAIVQELNRHEEECIRINGESNRAFGHPTIDRPHWLRFRAAMDTPNHFAVELIDGQTATAFKVKDRVYPLNEYVARPQCPPYIPEESIARRMDNIPITEEGSAR